MSSCLWNGLINFLLPGMLPNNRRTHIHTHGVELSPASHAYNNGKGGGFTDHKARALRMLNWAGLDRTASDKGSRKLSGMSPVGPI